MADELTMSSLKEDCFLPSPPATTQQWQEEGVTATADVSPIPPPPEDTDANQETSTTSTSDPEKPQPSTESSKDAMNAVTPIRKLLGLARPEASMLLLALMLMLVSEGLGLLNPLILARAYDTLVDPALSENAPGRMSEINQTMILVLTIHFTSVVLGFVRYTIMGMVGERVVARVRNQVYHKILQQEIAFFDQHSSGELVSRLGSDTSLLSEGTSMALPEVILGFIKVVASIAIMFSISPKLAGVMIGFVTIIMLFSVPFGKWLGRLSKEYQTKLGEAQTYSTEALGAMRTVQSFAAEEREAERYGSKIGCPEQYPCWYPVDCKTHPTTYSYGFFKKIVESALFTFIFGVGFGAMFVTLWYGFKLVTENEITLGELTAFQSYIFTIGASLGQTSQFVAKLIEAQGAATRIFFLLERVPEIPKPCKTSDNNDSKFDNDNGENPESPQKPAEFRGAVDFNNVHFSYPSRPHIAVLKNFSLSIHPNQTCAIVGSSGAGKSTVVALLQRFYDVNSGSITFDGHDIRSLDLHWLRSHIAYVQQEPQLFGLTVRENIAYGVSHSRHVTEEEIVTAARTANAHEFITKFPEGYDTLVGERGVQLSGGQKQRVAIARALLINPKLLLLDEATSALDAESEHLVQEAIDNAVVGRTVLIIAHRLSTIQRADQIVVVDNHQIADIGRHTELLERCSKYQELIKRQFLIGSLPVEQ